MTLTTTTAFAKTYRSFSKLKARKGDRRIKRKIRKEHRDLEDSECDITMKEMLRVIKEASNGKAAGKDDIPYEMVKQLGPKALGMLLARVNILAKTPNKSPPSKLSF